MQYQPQNNQLLRNHRLREYTTWKIGGVAEYFYHPSSLNDLINLLSHWGESEITLLGGGSNILIRDGGIRGLVIHLINGINSIAMEDNIIIAEAGAGLRQLVAQCINHGMVDAAFMVGIPGSLGGALKMNAGAYGDCIWNHIKVVTTINHRGEIKTRAACEFTSGYRKIQGLEKNEWFIAAVLEFSPGNRNVARSLAQKNMQKRRLSQPQNLPSCGSVFRNPEGDYAARLIEISGLKGKTLGGARVSEKHANFIANFDHATSQDVENLMEEIIERVNKITGIVLVPEVHIIGEAAR